jgi:D-tyrosyl-tRNA(Tyr) deacylase
MRAVVQRVSEGGVNIHTLKYSRAIQKGMVILLGIKSDDTGIDVQFVADKCSNLRIFEDANNKINLSLKDTGGEVLIISQFTLYGETSKGNRPNFTEAAKPEMAIPLYNMFIERMKGNLGEDKIKVGVFGEMMEVKIINDGPVTVIVESQNSK